VSAVETPPPVRVMAVDDHPMWRDAVERDLAQAGFDVVAVAATGREALARFPAAQPQVVVLDLQIPAPDGVAVTAHLREQDPSVGVLVLSASTEQGDVLAAVTAGATGYPVKSASGRSCWRPCAGSRLVLSHRTVQNHVQNTLRKLQMHNRVELTRYAIQRGLDAD
jgi:DNA-binding NarL/FixJ family response regulator